MARLHVEISMTDDQGRERLHAVVDEPTRLDVDRDPIYVFGRLDTLAKRAVDAVHVQALKINGEVWSD